MFLWWPLKRPMPLPFPNTAWLSRPVPIGEVWLNLNRRHVEIWARSMYAHRLYIVVLQVPIPRWRQTQDQPVAEKQITQLDMLEDKAFNIVWVIVARIHLTTTCLYSLWQTQINMCNSYVLIRKRIAQKQKNENIYDVIIKRDINLEISYLHIFLSMHDISVQIDEILVCIFYKLFSGNVNRQFMHLAFLPFLYRQCPF